ncbi:class I SAM-dependent methyltransferase [Moraxellaceae bacterium AER2_44_116]|nr:class I SAM-dependent methyltransferase [Moraxellaceae bacterium]TQC99361.1 class I SAM-dependent methyltransferase [Moraxellaceae bacterium AER2_44_116]
MDKTTIDSYNKDADNIAQLHASLIPEKLYSLINQHFIKKGLTADIGCGIGRDSHHLSEQGFEMVSIDGSLAMLQKAQEIYPNLTLQHDYLPNLNSLDVNTFENILCSAVLMHLHQADVKTACLRLLALLKNEGILIITLRGTHQPDKRENGKLYEDINLANLFQLFTDNQATVLIHEIDLEPKRQLTWHNLVIKKLPSLVG